MNNASDAESSPSRLLRNDNKFHHTNSRKVEEKIFSLSTPLGGGSLVPTIKEEKKKTKNTGP